ncbi:hypothetical protein M0812_20448 [Anaeramoeba flamelloides]|uniref:Uncharacterized protein n=1 Tax=Anaeramoeba flamelloides TaxID=1746091 RepID=A0AAV7YP83_9EUKA|nr:hypothetical protein M0812_20448 [Anaeramoeba flamelloides]
MNFSFDQTESKETEKELLEQLKHTHSMKTRLTLWLKLYPQSIIGLTIEHLNFNLSKSKKKSWINSKIKSKKATQALQAPTKPKEIRILRQSLNNLSEHTGVSRRSLERGLSSFFSRQYLLSNVDPYSREWLIFGLSKKIKANTQNPKKSQTSQKQKWKLKQKGKTLQFGKNNYQFFTDPQKNIQNDNVNKNNTATAITSKTLNIPDHFQFSSLENTKHHLINDPQRTQSYHQSNIQSQKQTQPTEKILPSEPKGLLTEETLLIQFKNQNRTNSLERKTPLEILCEVSQFYKKRKLTQTINPKNRNQTKPNQKNTGEGDNSNAFLYSQKWKSKN